MVSRHDTSVAILAGGFGTRLRSVVSDRPKVLAPVLGRPFLSYILDRLLDAGIREVVLCTGYKAEMLREYYGDSYHQIILRHSPEPSPLGTGGALRHALPLFKGRRILVLNGDSFLDADICAFSESHDKHMACISLVLAHVPDVGRYGLVSVNETGLVTGFVEKGNASGPGWINGGIYMLERKVVADIPAGREVSLEREVFPALLGSGFYAFPLGRRFIDIGLPESFAEATGFFQEFERTVTGERT